MSYNAPVLYDIRNIYNESFNPSAIHTKNTGLFWYYCDYLFKKILSVFEFSGLPKTWAENYFRYVLFGYGFVAIYKDSKYGVIPQNCSLSDTYTIFYQPKRVLIANPVLKKSIELEVGKDCEIIKVQPDYHSVLDIVSYYADMLAVSSEAMGMNLLNSKVSYVFMAENKAQAETFKKAYDRIGIQDDETEIMGVHVPHQLMPIKPGRNLAIIVEVAARNLSLKRAGYNAARELSAVLQDDSNE